MSFWHFVAGAVVGNWWANQSNTMDLDCLSEDEVKAVRQAVFRDCLFVCLCCAYKQKYGYDDSFFEHFVELDNPDSREQLEEFANNVVYGEAFDVWDAISKMKEVFEDDSEVLGNFVKRLELLSPRPLSTTARLVINKVKRAFN